MIIYAYISHSLILSLLKKSYKHYPWGLRVDYINTKKKKKKISPRIPVGLVKPCLTKQILLRVSGFFWNSIGMSEKPYASILNLHFLWKNRKQYFFFQKQFSYIWIQFNTNFEKMPNLTHIVPWCLTQLSPLAWPWSGKENRTFTCLCWLQMFDFISLGEGHWDKRPFLVHSKNIRV